MLPHNSIVSDLLVSVSKRGFPERISPKFSWKNMASVFLKEYCQSFPEGTSQEGCLKEYRQKYSCAVSFSWKPRPADSEGWRTFPAAALNNSIIQLLCFFNVKVKVMYQRKQKYQKIWRFRSSENITKVNEKIGIFVPPDGASSQSRVYLAFFSPCLTCSSFCLQFDHSEYIWSLWEYLITVKIFDHCENITKVM